MARSALFGLALMLVALADNPENHTRKQLVNTAEAAGYDEIPGRMPKEDIAEQLTTELQEDHGGLWRRAEKVYSRDGDHKLVKFRVTWEDVEAFGMQMVSEVRSNDTNGAEKLDIVATAIGEFIDDNLIWKHNTIGRIAKQIAGLAIEQGLKALWRAVAQALYNRQKTAGKV